MTRKEIRTLRDKIGTDPILTDEEIEYIWMAMDRQEPMKPVKEQRPGGHNICCPSCGCEAVRPVEWCWKCGQRQDWTEGKNARD